MMHACSGLGGFAEWGDDAAACEPFLELIAIIGARIDTRFARGEFHERAVEIREIGDEAHGGTVADAHRPDGVARATLRDRADAEQAPNPFASARERMVHDERVQLTPSPVV